MDTRVSSLHKTQEFQQIIQTYHTPPCLDVWMLQSWIISKTMIRNVPHGISPQGGFAAKLAADFPNAKVQNIHHHNIHRDHQLHNI